MPQGYRSNFAAVEIATPALSTHNHKFARWKSQSAELFVSSDEDVRILLILRSKMKRSEPLVASMAAAAAAAAAAASFSSLSSKPGSQSANDELALASDDDHGDRSSSTSSSSAEEKFAPRFDGLRFIETLVTAHR